MLQGFCRFVWSNEFSRIRKTTIQMSVTQTEIGNEEDEGDEAGDKGGNGGGNGKEIKEDG